MRSNIFCLIIFVSICLNYSCKNKISENEINKKLENNSYNYLITKREINRGSLILNDKHHHPIPIKTFLKDLTKNKKRIYLKDIFPPYEIIKHKGSYNITIVKNNDSLYFEIPKYKKIKDSKDPTFEDLFEMFKK